MSPNLGTEEDVDEEEERSELDGDEERNQVEAPRRLIRKTRAKLMVEDFGSSCMKRCGVKALTEAEMVEYYLADWRERLERDETLEDEDEILYPDVTGEKFQIKFVDTNRFNSVVALVIVLNAVCIGMETEANLGGGSTDTSVVWMLLEGLFGIIFASELICRLHCHRLDLCRRPSMLQSTLLDSLVVCASFVNIIMIYIARTAGGNARLFTMLRLARLLRLVRVLRLFKLFKELRMLLVGLISSFKILVWISIVLCLLSYCFAIWLTLVVGHNTQHWTLQYKGSANMWTRNAYDVTGDFNTMQQSIMTMVRMLTVEDVWESFVRYLAFDNPWLLFFFLGIFLVGTLALLNVMVGVVIEHVLVSAKSDNEYAAKVLEQKKKEVFSQLRSFFMMSDVNENGMLSMDEIQDALNTPELYNKLKMIDFPVDDPAYMFRALDVREDSQIGIAEFFEGCERAHGPLLSKDLLAAQVALDRLHRHYSDFEFEFDRYAAKVDFIATMSSALTEHGEHIFLNTQEYRSRHPTMRQTTRPRLSMAKLTSSSWDLGPGKKAAQVSWFEEEDSPAPPPLPDGPVPPEGSQQLIPMSSVD